MNKFFLISAMLTLILGCTATSVKLSVDDGFKNFVSSSGYHILDGEDTLRFISWNIPNLNYVEDEMKFESNNPYDLPTEFEIRDALLTIKEMGGQVTRMYTLPVRSSNLPSDAVTYVEGPGDFNEKAFQNLDLVMSIANEVGVRVIIPFLNNWQWFGGVPNYAEFRGKVFEDFWEDEQLWMDFQATVDHLLNRVNTITGTRYIDDKAIFCWESGNELQNPYKWVKKLAAHVKSIDSNHLFMDGFYALDNTPFPPEVFEDENIDIITSHHYEDNPVDMLQNIKDKVDSIGGRKPYFIGEFGFVSTTGLEMVLDYIVDEERIFGGMSWSIRYHHRDGGFYWHSEPSGLNLYKSFHWPGFETGDDYDESDLLRKFRDAAYKIQNKKIPPISIPNKPNLLEITDGNTVRWQGSVGARFYKIYRSEEGKNNWEVIEHFAQEHDRPYFSGYIDESSIIGKSYSYKIKAINESGESDFSNIHSVINLKNKLFVDHPSNTAKCLSSKNVFFEKGNDRDFKEMLSRMKGSEGSEVVYSVRGKIDSISVYSFSDDKIPKLNYLISSDGVEFSEVSYEFEEYSLGDRLYNYKIPAKYTITNDEQAGSFVKILFKDTAYIGRIEINYN